MSSGTGTQDGFSEGTPAKKKQPPKSESSMPKNTDTAGKTVVRLKLEPTKRDYIRVNVMDAIRSAEIEGVQLWDKLMGGTQKATAIEALRFHYGFPEQSAIDYGEEWGFKFKFTVPGTEHIIEVERKIKKAQLDGV
jgi:hypothetical protein